MRRRHHNLSGRAVLGVSRAGVFASALMMLAVSCTASVDTSLQVEDANVDGGEAESQDAAADTGADTDAGMPPGQPSRRRFSFDDFLGSNDIVSELPEPRKPRVDAVPEWQGPKFCAKRVALSCPEGARAVREGSEEYCRAGRLRHGPYRSWHDTDRCSPDEVGSFESGRKNGVWLKWAPSGPKAWELRYKNGRLDDAWTFWHANGQKAESIPFHSGQLHGTWKKWSAAGRLIANIPYHEGKVHGRWVEWSEDGELMAEIEYQHNVLSGSYWRRVATNDASIDWFVGGRVYHDRGVAGDSVESGRYLVGTRVGVWTLTEVVSQDDRKTTERIDEEPNRTRPAMRNEPMVEGSFDDKNRRHGAWTFRNYNDDTTLAHYRHGVPHGLWSLRVDDDKEPRAVCHMKDGEIVGCRFPSPQSGESPSLAEKVRLVERLLTRTPDCLELQGECGWWQDSTMSAVPRATGRISNNKKTGKWYWQLEDSPGDKTLEGSYDAAGNRHGPWIIRNSEGVTVKRGSYRHGALDGTWEFFSSANEPLGSVTMKSGTGLYRSWRDDGSKDEEGKLKDGKREGAWTSFHPGGTSQSEGVYRRGKKQGTWSWWNEAKQLVVKAQFRGGLLHGKSEASAVSGVLKGTHAQGTRSGVWTLWHTPDQRAATGRYVDGEACGSWRCWTADGSPLEGAECKGEFECYERSEVHKLGCLNGLARCASSSSGFDCQPCRP